MNRVDKQQAIILLTAAAIVAGFGLLRYWPVFRQKQALAAQMQQQHEQMEEIRAHSSLLPELRYQRRLLEEDLGEFVRKIPQSQDFAGLWQQIADAINTSKLRDQRVVPGAEIKTGRFCCIPLTIECRGSLEQIFSFFRAIEGMDRLIRVEDVSLENGPEFEADLTMKAKVSVYYQS